jgi:dTDP-4-dehydrorhamnose 3,5-epimerase
MAFEVVDKFLNGLILIKPDVYMDDRGFFMESFRSDMFEKLGIPTEFMQENHSKSDINVLRGLHFQWKKPQGKLIRVISGKAVFVEIDIRPNSPTLYQHVMVELNSDNKYMLWVPPGFANGFLSLSNNTEIIYKCTEIYNPTGESGISWNDPKLKINWTQYLLNTKPILSYKDDNAQTLSEWLQKKESSIFNMNIQTN